MSSFENKKEPFAHIFNSRLSKPCIAHPSLYASKWDSTAHRMQA
jgi:hypothetical protein